MLCGRLVAFVALLGCASPLVADAPDAYADKVRGLTHPRYAEREKAARELEAAGEPALGALMAAQSSADEELRSRASALVQKIEHAARSKRLLVAPTLSLKFEKVPLDQAVQELSRKTGLHFTLEAAKVKDLKRVVTLDTGTVPFWEAVEEFYRAAGLTEDDNPPPPGRPEPKTLTASRLTIYSRGPQSAVGLTTALMDGPSAPATTGLAFRVRTLPASSADNKYDDLTGEVTFHLDIDPVPGLEVQEILGIEVRRAVTDDRRALASAYPDRGGSGSPLGTVWAGQGQVIVLNGGDFNMDAALAPAGPRFPITLKAGAARPKRLAELHGMVVARVMAPPEPVVRATDVFGKGRGETFRAEGITCQVTAVNPTGGRFQPFAVAQGVAAKALPAPAPPASAPQSATITVRLVSSGEAANEVLNLPVRMKGRLRPFIRMNRLRDNPSPSPSTFQVHDADGKPIKVLSTWQTESMFDGTTLSREIQLTIEKPAGGLDGVSFTVVARRAVVVEMPFVLKDVPLP